MEANNDQTGRRPESDVGVKYITIGGKQIEAKYEICRRRVDIYGLHSGRGKNGNENRRPVKSQTNSFRNNRSDGIRNIGHKRQLNERQNSSLDSINTNNNNNNSYDSKESSVNGSVKSLPKETKTDKLMRKLENNNNGMTKNSQSLEQMAKKLKKEKEPVKVTNRFNTLLSSTNSDDFSEIVDKISAKNKNKKKKNNNKLSIGLFDVKTVDKSDENVIFEDTIDFNDDFESSESVPQMEPQIDSLAFSPKSDNFFEANNNNNNLSNYFEKSDDNLSKLNENKVVDQMAHNFKVYKNPIRENSNLLNKEFSDEKRLDLSDSDDDKWNRVNYVTPNEIKVEDSSHSNDVNDQTIGAAKTKSAVFSDAVLTHRQKRTKDYKSKVLSIQSHKEVTKWVPEVTEVPDMDTKSSAMKWALLLVGFLVFLMVYSKVILNTFCVCN